MVAPEQVPINRKPMNELHFRNAVRSAAPCVTKAVVSDTASSIMLFSITALRVPAGQAHSALQNVIGHFAFICFVPLKDLCSRGANQTLCRSGFGNSGGTT
jgi:hypothetical protein